MDRLFAGPEGAAAAAAGGAAAAAGGGSQCGGAPKVMSFRGWTLDMLQVTVGSAGWFFAANACASNMAAASTV